MKRIEPIFHNQRSLRRPKMSREQEEMSGPKYPISPNNYCYCGSQQKFKTCCLYSKHRRQSDNMVELGGYLVYRTSRQSDIALRQRAESALRQKFEPGAYTDLGTVEAILKHQVDFFGNRFDELIMELVGRDFLDFLWW